MSKLLGNIWGAIFGRKSSAEESKRDELIKELSRNPEMAAKLHQLAALKRMENIHNLHASSSSMAAISIEEQQAYVMMLDFMKGNSSQVDDKKEFEDFLHKMKIVHFKGNSILGSYLREIG